MEQDELGERYSAGLPGVDELGPSDGEQLGFRPAARLEHETIRAIDDWRRRYMAVDRMLTQARARPRVAQVVPAGHHGGSGPTRGGERTPSPAG